MKSPCFILCSPRSFSSVVCAMIGQHPELYGLPEVNLTIGDTVEEMLNALAGREQAMHGLYRALAELRHGEQTDEAIGLARAWLEQHRDWPTKRVFETLNDAVAPRALVVNSPRMVMQSDHLQRALDMFPDASFLHLVRHPFSMGQSLISGIKEDAARGTGKGREKLDPEQIWLRGQRNAHEFAARLPEGQCLRIRAEELLSDPETYLPQIAEWLDVDAGREAVEKMLHPEHSSYAGYGPGSARFGNDPEFLESPATWRAQAEFQPLAAPLPWAPEREIAPETRKLAREYGYG